MNRPVCQRGIQRSALANHHRNPFFERISQQRAQRGLIGANAVDQVRYRAVEIHAPGLFAQHRAIEQPNHHAIATGQNQRACFQRIHERHSFALTEASFAFLGEDCAD